MKAAVHRILIGILLVLVLAAACAYTLLPHQAAAFILAMGHAAAGLEARSVDVMGFRIRYLDGGKGEPLILLHGIGADKDNWLYTSVLLARHYRVIAVDLPGFGESSKPAAAHYGVEAQVERLHAFMQALRIRRAHFGGNSMGGLIAAVYAARYPDEVESLWLLDPPFVQGAKPSEMIERILGGDHIPLFASTIAQFDQVLDFVMVHPPFMPSPVKRVLAERQVDNYALNVQIFKELSGQPMALERTLAGLRIPTLIVWGDRDRVLDVSSAAILHQVLPRSRVIIMRGIGHVPMVEAPYRTARDYIAFRHGLERAQDGSIR